MKRLALAATMAATTLATPIAAFEIGEMTQEERLLFRSEVRNYLMENPEVLLEAINVLEQRQADEQAANDVALLETNSDAIFNDGYSFVGGNPDGDITMVEFMDYRCGYCRKAHPDVNALLETDGNIRFVVKEFPILGEQSVLASRFAIAVKQVEGDDAYWDTHNALMTMRGEVTEDALSDMSEQMGYDTPAVFDAMNGEEVEQVILKNRELAQRLQIQGTPSFVIGDELLRGYIPLEGMMQLVEDVRTDS